MTKKKKKKKKKEKELLGPDSIFLFGFTNAKVKLLVMYRLQMRADPFTLPFFFFLKEYIIQSCCLGFVDSLHRTHIKYEACTLMPLINGRSSMGSLLRWYYYHEIHENNNNIIYIYIYIITLTPLHKLAEPYQRADTKKRPSLGGDTTFSRAGCRSHECCRQISRTGSRNAHQYLSARYPQ